MSEGRSASGPGRRSLAAVALVFSAVFTFNAYVCDDAFIAFRTLDNFVRGYGLRWNPAERVQVFTSPLHSLALAALYWVSHDRAWLPNPNRIYFTALGLAYALSLASVLRFARCAASARVLWPCFLLLMSSQAFATFCSSGLETPLTYLLLVLFAAGLLADGPWTLRRCFWLFLWASLGTLNRLDNALLFLPGCAWVVWQGWRAHGAALWRPAALAALPLLLWLGFALVYFGFPLPNTYYAKIGVGADSGVLARMGRAYLALALIGDPVTLLAIAAGAALSWREPRAALAALGALLYVGYAWRIGGDFLGFRLLAPPFLVCVLLIQRRAGGRPRSRAWSLAAVSGVLLYGAITPSSPWRAWRDLPKADDVRFYFLGSNLARWRPGLNFPFAPFREFRSFEQCREWRTQQPTVTIAGGGLLGFCLGPHHHLLMPAGITDPLMARLPVAVEEPFLPGHLFKPLPEGYLESVRQNRNAIPDPELAGYYDALRRITRGPVWSAERWLAMARLNLTRDRRYRAAYPPQSEPYPRAYHTGARSLVEKLADREWLERQFYVRPFARLLDD